MSGLRASQKRDMSGTAHKPLLFEKMSRFSWKILNLIFQLPFRTHFLPHGDGPFFEFETAIFICIKGIIQKE